MLQPIGWSIFICVYAELYKAFDQAHKNSNDQQEPAYHLHCPVPGGGFAAVYMPHELQMEEEVGETEIQIQKQPEKQRHKQHRGISSSVGVGIDGPVKQPAPAGKVGSNGTGVNIYADVWIVRAGEHGETILVGICASKYAFSILEYGQIHFVVKNLVPAGDMVTRENDLAVAILTFELHHIFYVTCAALKTAIFLPVKKYVLEPEAGLIGCPKVDGAEDSNQRNDDQLPFMGSYKRFHMRLLVVEFDVYLI